MDTVTRLTDLVKVGLHLTTPVIKDGDGVAQNLAGLAKLTTDNPDFKTLPVILKEAQATLANPKLEAETKQALVNLDYQKLYLMLLAKPRLETITLTKDEAANLDLDNPMPLIGQKLVDKYGLGQQPLPLMMGIKVNPASGLLDVKMYTITRTNPVFQQLQKYVQNLATSINNDD